MPGTRDLMIVTDVDKMADLKRFDEEVTVYGSTYWSNLEKQPYYIATSDLEKLENYIERKQYTGVYFTPIISMGERYTIPAGAYEYIISDMQEKLLRRMKEQFEPEYYSVMPSYYDILANDNAVPYLQEFAETINGRFEKGEVMLLIKTVQYAYRLKILQQKSYDQFNEYCTSILHQMENDPTMKKSVNRTFFGFYYLKNGIRKNVINAQKQVVVQEYNNYSDQGLLVAPILCKRYALDNYNQIPNAKKHFEEWLTLLESESYLDYLLSLKSLPGVIDEDELSEEGKAWNKLEACSALMHYQKIWNMK